MNLTRATLERSPDGAIFALIDSKKYVIKNVGDVPLSVEDGIVTYDTRDDSAIYRSCKVAAFSALPPKEDGLHQGKSEIVNQVAQACGWPCIDLRLSQNDAESSKVPTYKEESEDGTLDDLIGFLMRIRGEQGNIPVRTVEDTGDLIRIYTAEVIDDPVDGRCVRLY